MLQSTGIFPNSESLKTPELLYSSFKLFKKLKLTNQFLNIVVIWSSKF